MEEKRENKTHRMKASGPKAERKKSKNPIEQQNLSARQRNPKAFSIQHANKTLKTVQRTQDLKTKKQHIPIVDRTPVEPPPIIVGVVGPPKVGKTTLLKCVVKNFTKQRLTRIQGPVTVVSGKQRRLTMIECNNDINSMIDIAKVADLVLLLVDASFGFEMETFEFLNICQVHGFPRIMGVLTHLDSFKDSKRLRKTKKRLKHRFWTEVYQGAKLFYLSGMVNGEYQKTEVHNLCRFISVMKFRPLTWRTTHPYILADRMEDITDPEKVRQHNKSDRNVSLYGYLHGTHMKNNTNIHIPGCGDFSIHDLQFLTDPCPTPDQNKKRSLSQRDRVVYAPMSGVGGIVYDKDAVYIDLGGSHSHTDPQNMDDDDEPKVANELVASLMAMNNPVDKKMKSSEVSLYSSAFKKSDTADQDEGYSEESVETDGRVRRKAVFADSTNDDEDDDDEDSSDNESSDDDDDDDDDDDGGANEKKVTKKLRASRDSKAETGIEFADTDDELEDSQPGADMDDSDDDSDGSDDDDEIKINIPHKKSKPQNESSSDDDSDDDDDDDDEVRINIPHRSKSKAKSDDSSSDDDDDSDDDDGDSEKKLKKSDKLPKPQDDSDDTSDDDDSSDDDDDEVCDNSNNKKAKTGGKTSITASKAVAASSVSSSKGKTALDNKANKSQSKPSKMSSDDDEDDGDDSSEEEDSSDEEEMDVDNAKSDKKLKADTVKSIEVSTSGKPGKSLSEKLMNLSQKDYFSLNAKEKSHDDVNEEEMTEDKKGDKQIDDSTKNKPDASTVDLGNENNDGSMTWRHDLMSQAAASFRRRQSERINYRKLIYGKGDENEAAAADEEEEDEIGGLFRVLKEKSEASSKDRVAINSTDCTKCQIHTLASIDIESIRELIADCFVTGKWDENEDAEVLLQKDDDLYGDFEDLETGEKHAGTADTQEDAMEDDADDDGGDDDEDDEKQPEEVKKKKADMTADERRDEKKRKLKEMFDTQYDMKGDTEFYDNWKEELNQQAKINRSMFEDMDDETRVQYEGFRPGMYVRVEIQGVPCEFVTNFDATYPVILGGLLSVENNVGYVQTRIKKHRWHKKILKNKNPLIISLGWRRFQSIPLYFIQDHNMRNRMLKYTPQHLHCHSTFWGPITPQGTGLLAVENVADTTADFRIAATGVVVELDKSQQIMKKLKLTGNPQKIYKKTAFVEGMFNSALEVAKFEGASIRTVSGVRGQIKKAAKSPEGAFRATFEDRILLSDIVFLRTWYPVEVPQFYNPVTTLLLPASQKQGWTGLKTMGQLHREKHTKPTFSDDSVYKKIERKGKSYAPLSVPKALQKMLPFKDTPKSLVEKKETVKRVAIIREPHEAKISKMVAMLKSVHEHKKRTEHAQMRERAQKHQKEKMKVNKVKQQKHKEIKKNVFRMLGKMEKRKNNRDRD